MHVKVSVLPVGGAAKNQNSQSITEKTVETATVKNNNISNSKKTDNKLQELQKSLAAQNIDLRFSSDVDTRTLVVEIMDYVTGKAILQLPSKLSLRRTAEVIKSPP
ncbi:MAG: flagellar protein FlaG [Pyrinomonadaceae bacterium]